LDISRKGVIGSWRILYNGEIRSLYCLPNIVRVIKLEEVEKHVTHTEEARNSCKIFGHKNSRIR
jgi:hypothetical protein